MSVRIKLTVGFLTIVLLIWATIFVATNTYTNIHEEFEALEGDIIPGTMVMSEMAEKAHLKTRIGGSSSQIFRALR